MDYGLKALRGSTLIEFVVYIGVIGLVLSAVVTFAVEFLATRAKADSLAEAAWNARFGVGYVAAELRSARGYNAAASTFGTNPSVLVVCGATVPCPAVADQTAFTVTDGRLTVKYGAAAAVPITSSKVTITDFTVTDLSTGGTRSRNFRIGLTSESVGTGLWAVQPSASYETTERIRRLEGFSN